MSKEIILRNVRLSYAHLDTPTSFIQGQGFVADPEAGVYSATLVIPKGSQAEKELLAAVTESKGEALASGIRGNAGKITKITTADIVRFNPGIKDGDTKDDDVYLGSVYVTAKAKLDRKPTAYDKDNNRIENSALYSGCYVNACVRIYNYVAASNFGCSYALVALQFFADGEPLSSNTDTDSIFGEKKVSASPKKDDMSGMF